VQDSLKPILTAPLERIVSKAFVIFVAIILAIFLVVFSSVVKNAHVHPPGSRTRNEMQNLIFAIQQYETTYSRFPLPPGVTQGTNADFTFGTFNTSKASLGITNASGYQANNSELMAILTDTPLGTLNSNHSLNPMKLAFFMARIAPDTNSHGLGPDCVLRDDWGNPYIISIHINGEKKCRDAFYSLPSICGTNSGEIHESVVIWSLGPDGNADRAKQADAGANKDNILSWKN
jgi:hypothetical protein